MLSRFVFLSDIIAENANRVHFHSTFFEDHSVIDTEPFLANFDNPNLTISDCIANNTISGCIFDSSAETFTGGIMRGTFLSTTLLAVNSTWTRTTSRYIRVANYDVMDQVNTTGDATFRHCSWTGTSSSGPGGAIYVDRIGSLTVDDCQFTDCKGARRTGGWDKAAGGGIFFESNNVKPISINESYFLRCHATGLAGSLGIYNSSKCSLTRTNFSHSTTDLSIPTLHFRGLPADSVLTNLRFEHGHGTETAKTANSGAIDFDKILGTLYHSNILYSNNTATFGGAVYYSAVDPTSKPNVTWFSCIFYSNKATTQRPTTHDETLMSCGNDIWIGTNHEEWNKTLANDATFTNCFSTSDFPRIAINLSPDLATRFPNGTELSTRLPDPILFVSSTSAGNNEECGHSYHLPCLTLAYTITNCLAVARGEILIEAGSFNENEACQISLKDLKVTSYGNEYPILKTTTNTPFIVVTSTYALWMQWISFEVHASSVIKHQGSGTLTLESCTFHGSSSPALTASTLDIGSGKVILENVIFHELVFGQGSALDCRNAQSVALSEVGFACVDSTQSSPLRLEQIQSSLSVGKIYFEDCAGSAFSDIVVDATSLSKTSGGFPSSDSTSTTPRSAEFSGSQLTEWPSYEMVVDGNDGKEDWFCWRSGQKCKTIGGLVGRLGKDFVGSVSVEIGTTAETSILVDERSISVTGKDMLTAKVELNDSPNVVRVTSQAILSFSTLTFVLMSPNPANCLFSSLGTLTLTNVKLTHKADGTGRTGTVFTVSGGTTTLTNCGLDGEGKRMGHLASVVQTGKLVVSSSNFKNLVLEASLLVGTGDMTLLGTTFESISDGTAGSPSVRVLEPTIGSGKTVKIDSSSSFISCSSTGNGGALKITLVSSGTLTISDTSFKSCSATGNGGGIWLDLTQSTATNPFTFSDLTFGTDATQNTASKGRNVYALAKTGSTDVLRPLRAIVPATPAEIVFDEAERTMVEFGEVSSNVETEIGSLLYLFYPSGNDVRVRASVGFDHSLCGASLLPCSSLQTSYTNAPSRNDNSASVVLDADFPLTETIAAQNKAITITSASQNTLTFGASAQLIVVSDTLTLMSLKLGLPSSITTTPFVVSGGSLIIESSADISHAGTDVTPTTLSCPLMSITSGSLSMAGTSTTPRALSFFSNSASTDCCLIKIEGAQNEAPSLTLSSCHFTDCSMANGAVMMFGGASSGSVDLEECYFSRNEGSTSNDVFATATWAAAFSNETVINCFSDSDMNHLVIGSTPQNDLIPYSILGVNPSSQDDTKCHLPGFSCTSVRLSLGHCIQKENETRFALRLIEIEDDVIETDTLIVGSRRVVIFGSSDTISLTWNSAFSLLTLSDGSASLKSFTLAIQSPSSLSSPLMVLLSTGTLSLTSIRVDGENSVFTQSLINAEIGSLQISSSSFRNIEMSDYALIETDCVVHIEECSFSDITREGKNATILSAHISQATPPSVSSSVSMRKTSFENCMPTESQRWVELIGRNSETFSSSSWTGTFNKTSIWGGVVVDDVLTEIEDDLKPFSLIYEFFRRTDSKLIVSSVSGNVDHPLCGHSQLPCRSIDVGRKLTSVQTMEIVSIGEIGGVLEVGNETVQLSGHNGRGKMGLVGTGQIVSNDETDPGRLFVSQLEIDVSGSTLIDQSVFWMKAGSLNFESCSLISSKAVASTLILNEGSSVLMTNTTFALNTTGAGMLVDSTKGSVELTLIHLTSCSFQSTPFSFSDATSVTLTSIEMSLCKVSELVSVQNVPSFSLVSSSFVGSSSAPNEEDDTSCEWSTGLISISDCESASVVSSRFTALSQGALLISNSNVTIATTSFSLNTPTSAPSEQVRRNIRCENSSTVEIESLNGGDGAQTTSHWISADESCAVTKETKKLSPALFAPTLTTKSSSSVLDKKKGSFNVTLTGTELIPCGLFLEVYELTTENDPKTKEIALTKDKTTKLTQTVITLSVTQSELGMNPTLEWRGRLLYENGLRSESFIVKMSATDERKSQAKQVMRWLGPLIGGLVALFLLLLIILLLVRRHRKKKESQLQNPAEMNSFDEVIVKDDGFQQTDVLNHNSTFSLDDPIPAIPTSEATDHTRLPAHNTDHDGNKVQKDEIIAAVSFEDCATKTPMSKHQSLYSRLHGQTKIDFDKLKLQMQLARGVERLVSQNAQAAELANLSPHTIFIDAAGNLFFKASTTNDLGAFFGSCPTSLVEESKVGHENQRWQAPEVRPTNQQLDMEKAAVFSLGLLLWEIETEEIPMKELDAANAQRVLGAGMQLDMEHIHPDEFSDAIIRCIHRSPSERPTAADAVKLLEELEKNENKPEALVPPNPVQLHNL
ncbi:hypothetical protein BLNAU_5864 [Blattamonas nauphoetae]|uniref:Protein kinase domain-containing protein n=1 Tax=Blattamonas nauphoetae TaxID=2049346 RepID=A0ABQ9Y5S4_9EUKA|nr:hypothetical protein BLNAU_5864 [Blattamonas nauphoetae]